MGGAPTAGEADMNHWKLKTRVCEVCGSAALTQQKKQGSTQMKTHFFHCVNGCKGPKGYIESTWSEEPPKEDAYTLKHALRAALDEVAWLTKQNDRLRAADAARLARWEEEAKSDEERAAEAAAEAVAEDSAAAADIYASLGRDEWPTR